MIHKCIVFILTLMMLSSLSCSKNTKLDGYGDPIKLLKAPDDSFVRFTLDNGLEVLVVERHVTPIVTILAAVKNGAIAESDEYDGLSHLYEHMFFKGNRALPSQHEYMKRMRELGMSFNGTTSTEAVQYFFTLPKENFDQGVVFMRDALLTPLFDETELKTEVKTVLGEYDRNESNPMHHLRQAVTRALFPPYFSRKNVIGNRDVIQTATREKMLEIQRRYYVPNNTMLVIAGDVNAEQVKKAITKEFNVWPRSANPYDLYPAPKPRPIAGKTIIVERPYNNVMMQLSWQGPSIDEDRESTYAADVFSFILSQRASKFNQNLVDSGLLHVAGLGYYTQRNVGPINYYGLASPDKAEKALEAMKLEVGFFGAPDYYTDEELENAKLQLAVSNIYDWQNSLSIAQNLGFWWCISDIEYQTTYIEKLKKVSREDITKYLNKYIIGRPHITGILKAPEQVQTAEKSTDTTNVTEREEVAK